MRSIGKSDFAGLVKYITDEQGKTERLGNVKVTNCQADTMQAVIGEVLATQHQNTRAESDKTFHLLLGFPPGEKPEADILMTIEERICAGLGYGNHQRVSAVHYDTDHLHIHIAINKIHPTRNTMHDPFQSYRTLGDLCSTLETEYGLQRVNHINRRTQAEGRAADMEQHAGIESLVSWIRRECLDEIKGVRSWGELHQVMRENDLKLRQRANGFVIEAISDGTMVKASTVARDLSKPKLEVRLGAFEPSDEQTERGQAHKEYKKRPMRSRVNTVELYAKYQEEQHTITSARGEAWEKARRHKDLAIKAAKQANKLRRTAIKLMGGTGVTKKLLYIQAHKALRDRIEMLGKQYKKERTDLYEQYKRCAWADWLKQKALKGDKQALEALRARDVAQRLKGDTIKGQGKTQPGHGAVTDNITKKGTIIFRAGTSAVRDDGDKLQVRQATTEVVEQALRIVMQRYGNRITVNGTAEFKAQVIRTAVTAKLPVTFADPELERRRQSLFSDNQERTYDRTKREQTRTKRGRVNRRSIGHTGPRATDRGEQRPGISRTIHAAGEQRKPNVGRIGRVPPPQSQHRLRTLSQLGMVRIPGGAEMLLSRNVSGNVEQQRTKPDNQLRRGIFESRVTREQVAATDKYIAEREDKRLKGFDIPKHFRYNAQSGVVLYAGIRNIEGQTLALLKRGDQMLVLPIDQSTARRLKRVTIGDPVTITSLGSIKTSTGKSR